MADSMDQQNQQPQQEPQQGGDQSQGQDAPKQLVDGMMAVQSALSGFGQALSQVPQVPKEALDALQVAVDAYNKFLSLAMKGLGVEGAPDMGDDEEGEGSQDEMSSGNKKAIPADQMMGGRTGKQVY